MCNSFFIKTSNCNMLNYLINNLDDSKRISKENLLSVNTSITTLCNVLTDFIVKFYEEKLLINLISLNYFYFTDIEQNSILDLCKNCVTDNELEEVVFRKDLIYSSLFEYLSTNNYIIIDGFVNFRLTNYISSLDLIVDLCVNKFIIDKEYLQFINLLKEYVFFKDSLINIVHIIYSNGESILLDESKKIIEDRTTIFYNKYVSDINFSSNDFTLNNLLNLLPAKIIIHILDYEDQFINSLKLIFGNRVYICTSCNLCKNNLFCT